MYNERELKKIADMMKNSKTKVTFSVTDNKTLNSGIIVEPKERKSNEKGTSN